jgi:hypothetical protein
VNDLAVDDHTRCGHDTVAHDLTQFFDLVDLDFDTTSLGDVLDEFYGVLAVGTSGAEYLDRSHGDLLTGRD